MSGVSPSRHSVAHRDVDVGDGLVLHCASSGVGPPLVLLHGFTGSTASWLSLRELLDPHRTVVALDLPGHGRSSTPPDAARYALGRFREDLVQVFDALELPHAAVLGYSLGARSALAFAAAHPSRVDALIVVSGSPGIDDESSRRARAGSDAELADRIERDGIEAFVRHWETLPLWESQRNLDEAARAALRTQRRANDARGLANSLRGAGAGAAPSLASVLGDIRAPALIVAGALDPKYLAIARDMAAAISQATVAVVPGAGHAVALERPRELAARVLDFLDGR